MQHVHFLHACVHLYLLLLENRLLLQDFDCVKLVVGAVACQQDFAEAPLADHLQEVEVVGFG